MENLNIVSVVPETVDVSIVLPFYNAHEYIGEALESILAQSFERFEVLCVDDGSTDRSLDLVKTFKERDSRVRIITENNAGPAAARNKGLARARGKYVIFLDADDFYEPNLISRLYELSERESLDIAVANYDIYNTRRARFEPNVESDHYDVLDDGSIISKTICPDYILQCTTGYVWNKLFRRDFLFENKLVFNTDIKIFEDVHFVATALVSAARIAKDQTILVHHRIYSDQSRPKMFKKYYAQVPVVYSEIKKFLMQRGIYAPISRSFVNLSASRCYKIYNILWKDAKESFWNILHKEYSGQLDWDSSDQTEIEDSDVKSFIAAVTLYTHKQYVKRRKTVEVKKDSSMDQKFERKQALGRFLDSFRLRRR